MRRVVSVLVGVLLCVPLAGCVRETAGVSASPATPSTGVPLPPRPRDIDIRNVDPCSLLTASQRAELGLDGDPNYDVARSPLFEGPEPACTVRGYEPRAVAVGVALPYDGLGINAFAAPRVRSEVILMNVQGFPAVQAVPSEQLMLCSVVVDLGPGAALNVQYRDGGRRPAVPRDELCAGAIAVAEASMATLLALA